MVALPTPGLGPRGRVVALDGVRGAALVLVLLVHSSLLIDQSGVFALEFFFVLSGYLITNVLLDGRDGSGRLSLRRFYLRRALRILPALLVMLALTTPFGTSLSNGYTWEAWFQSVLAVLAYVGNFFVILSDDNPLGSLGPLWSLAVEEQFYALWPLALLGLLALPLGRRGLTAVVSVVALACLSLFWLLYAPFPYEQLHPDVYYRPDARAGEVLLGCALGLGLRAMTRPLPRRADRLLGAAAWLGIGVTVAAYLIAEQTGDYRVRVGILIPAVALGATAVVARLVTSDRASLSRLLRVAPLPWLGRLSYAAYLWHVPIFAIVQPGTLGSGRAGELTLELTLVLVVAWLSAKLVEEPALRLRIGRRPPQPPPELPAKPPAAALPALSLRPTPR